MERLKGLKCRECGRYYPSSPIHVCEFCFGPLEVVYDYGRIKKALSRKVIESRPENLWRYRELLPINGEPLVGLDSGFTPFFHAKRLGKFLGLKRLYIKDDSVCHPTLSFKDRVVAVALTRAKEFGFDTVSCASTGNLANAVAAHAAKAGLKRYIFIPADLEASKVLGSLVYAAHVVAVEGTYDEVNRLCAEIAGKYKWAFVNVNIRPYYAEGSKTYGFEVAEQLGWKTPDHIVVPVASGSLLVKIAKAFREFHKIGLIPAGRPKLYGAQAQGCAPVATAFRDGAEAIRPVRPKTICKSLAIGNPADGVYALGEVRGSGGAVDEVTDEEIVQGIKMLAETEGVFAETAGGVTAGVLKKLVKQGKIGPNETVVLCVTGNGLKTQEAVAHEVGHPTRIRPTLASFESEVKS